VSENVVPLFKDRAFEPQATAIMAAAYDRACETLHDVGQAALVREIIAKRIVEVAQTGERDPQELCARALLALGIKIEAERPAVAREAPAGEVRETRGVA
jgi:hypothetical protein